jgi:hypothetical protein
MSMIRERSAHPSAGAFADVCTGVIVEMANVGRKRPSYHGGRRSGLAKAMVSRRSCQKSKIAYEHVGPLVVDDEGIPLRRRHYQDLYRDVANAAGVPRGVWNMFARHGEVTEAHECGAALMG